MITEQCQMNYKSMILFLLALFFAVSPADAQHDKYFFRNLEGRAVLSRTGGSTWLALQQSQPVELKPGDMVNVEGDGRGELMFPDGTVVRMKNNAMITLMRYGINLRLGYVWLNVRRSSEMFKVISPLGSCSVLGTSFDVDVDRYGRTSVRVFSGIVAVRASSDARNRQLVLQPGMRTVISENTKVADKPDKFQSSTVETSIVSEWNNRQPTGQPPALSAFKRPSSAVTAAETSLPPIRPEITTAQIELPPVNEVVSDLPAEMEKEERLQIIARQRSGFIEMLRQQQLARDSVIGGRFEEKEDMQIDQHGSELGQCRRLNLAVDDNDSLDREYSLLRNRFLRVQSQIRQKELEMATLINQNISTSAQKRKISSVQSQLVELQGEHQLLIARLRDIQTKKR
jgi:hypothetical protein